MKWVTIIVMRGINEVIINFNGHTYTCATCAMKRSQASSEHVWRAIHALSVHDSIDSKVDDGPLGLGLTTLSRE